MNTDLRLILLIIGCGIILVMLLDAMRRNRQKAKMREQRCAKQRQDSMRKNGQLEDDFDDVLLTADPDDLPRSHRRAAVEEHEPVLRMDAEADSWSEPYADDEPVISSQQTEISPVFDDESTDVAPKTKYIKPIHVVKKPMSKVIVLHVLAEEGYEYEGEGLVEALQDVGLEVNAKGMFEQLDDTDQVLFRLVSAIEPGVFDMRHLDTFATPGVSFLLDLTNAEVDLMHAYERMLDSAHRLTDLLDGQLLDEKYHSINAQIIAGHRHQVLKQQRISHLHTEATV